MLSIFVIFLLVQVLSATNEFPDLIQGVQVLWDGVDLTSQIDARLTSSIDNEVPYFFLCAPFLINYNGGNCQIEFYEEFQGTESIIGAHKGTFATFARYIGGIGGRNTCMTFYNPIYKFIEKRKLKWYVHYTCESVKPIPKPDPKSDSNSMGLYAVGVVLVMVLIGVVAFKVGQKKGKESSQGNTSGAYKALGGNYKGNRGNLSYGNPFAQTA